MELQESLGGGSSTILLESRINGLATEASAVVKDSNILIWKVLRIVDILIRQSSID